MYELQDDLSVNLKPRRRWRWAWITLLLLLVAGGAGYYGYITYLKPQPVVTEQATQQPATAQARRGNLTVTVSGVGNLVAANSVNLAFSSSGKVTQVLVKPGDHMAAGQTLATVDDSTIRAQIVQAGINLRKAQLQVVALTPSTSDIAAAKANLASAQLNLKTATDGATTEQLASAKDDLLSAQQALNKLVSGASADEKTVAESSLKAAQVTLQQAQSAYNKVSWRSDIGATQQSADLQNATIEYEKALAQYNITVAASDPSSITAARSKVAQAQQTLNDLQSAPDALTLQQRQAQVEQAQAQLDALVNGPDKDQLETANLGVQQAKEELNSAMNDLNGTVITSPITGTVTAVNLQVGTQAGTSPAITIAGEGSAQVQFWIDELDIGSVVANDPVNIVFDAYPNLTFNGTVIRVDPSLVTVNGAAVGQVWATINMSQYPSTLLYGMNAQVEVVAGTAQNAVLVPVQALRELAPGSYAVFVVDANNELEMRPVEVGIKDAVNAEIRSGVDEGETVSTGNTQTQTGTTP